MVDINLFIFINFYIVIYKYLYPQDFRQSVWLVLSVIQLFALYLFGKNIIMYYQPARLYHESVRICEQY